MRLRSVLTFKNVFIRLEKVKPELNVICSEFGSVHTIAQFKMTKYTTVQSSGIISL